MTRGRRLSFLAVAAVIAVLAAVLLGSDKGETGPGSAKTPTPASTRVPSKASPRETATPTPAPVLSSANETALTVTEGDTVRFCARSDSDDEVHVHGYDLKKHVKAGATVAFAFKADITGIFEIEFEKSGTLLAQLKVLP